eukprot:247649-Pleurochrysis_carterae.AAC.5
MRYRLDSRAVAANQRRPAVRARASRITRLACDDHLKVEAPQLRSSPDTTKSKTDATSPRTRDESGSREYGNGVNRRAALHSSGKALRVQPGQRSWQGLHQRGLRMAASKRRQEHEGSILGTANGVFVCSERGVRLRAPRLAAISYDMTMTPCGAVSMLSCTRREQHGRRLPDSCCCFVTARASDNLIATYARRGVPVDARRCTCPQRHL